MNCTLDNYFKMLADNTRLRCLMLMQAEGELCVCELTHAMDVSQPKMSRHLAHLREADIITARRSGTWMYYQINSKLPLWMLDILQITLTGAENSGPFSTDKTTLLDMKNRPGLACCL